MVSRSTFPTTAEALEAMSADELETWLDYAEARRDAAATQALRQVWDEAVAWLLTDPRTAHRGAGSVPDRDAPD